MYREIKDSQTGEIASILRLDDGAHIPPDPANRDYAAFLAWLEDGNTLPADPLPALDDLKAAALAQIDAKVAGIFALGYTVASGAMAGEVLQIRNNTDRTNWLTSQAAYGAAIAAGAGATAGAVFRTTANHTFTISYRDGFGVIMDMAAWGQLVYARSWALKDAVNAAEDQAALGAIDLNSDWPV